MSVILFVLLLVIPQPAYAYIDPGTGSVILQALIAGVLGGLFVIKSYWAKIVAFFRKKGKDE